TSQQRTARLFNDSRVFHFVVGAEAARNETEHFRQVSERRYAIFGISRRECGERLEFRESKTNRGISTFNSHKTKRGHSQSCIEILTRCLHAGASGRPDPTISRRSDSNCREPC